MAITGIILTLGVLQPPASPSPTSSSDGPGIAGEVPTIVITAFMSAVAASLLTYFFAPFVESRRERGRRGDEAVLTLRDGLGDLREAIEVARRNMANPHESYPTMSTSAPPILLKYLGAARRLPQWKSRLFRRTLLAFGGLTVLAVRRIGVRPGEPVFGEELIAYSEAGGDGSTLAEWLARRSMSSAYSPLTPAGYEAITSDLDALADALTVRRWQFRARLNLRRTGMPSSNPEIERFIDDR